jgi:two-component system OmpR family response regulator
LSIKRSNESSIQRILVIDDNKDTTEMLDDFFDSEGIECIVVNEGKKGLEEIRNYKVGYDLILLDLTIPEFSGWDIFKKLKEENLLESNNVIIFTASTKTNNEIDELIKEGAKYVLKKPFSLEELEEITKLFKNNTPSK